MNDRSSHVDALVCRLIDLCRDEEESFLAAAEEVPTPRLRNLLQSVARQRESFGRTLREFLPTPQPEAERVMQRLEMLYQGWVDFRLARVGGDVKAILRECEKEERHALAAYQRALSASLPPALSAALAQHCDEVQSTCQRMHLWQEQADFTDFNMEPQEVYPVAIAG